MQDGRKNTAAEADADRREEESGDEGADDADNHIADEAKAKAFDDETGEPACDCADDQEYEDAFDTHEWFPFR
ncbi:hypothetical protein D9M70_573990 [compost metagenome]